MPRKSQFQNLTLQQTLEEIQNYALQRTIVQPALTLPIKPEKFAPLPPLWPARGNQVGDGQDSSELVLAQGKEVDLAPMGEAERREMLDVAESSPPLERPAVSRKKKLLRASVLLLTALLLLALYFTWHSATPTAASPTVTQQALSGAIHPQSTPANDGVTTQSGESSEGTIQVYVTGAIRHPGVYTLPVGARVYQLIQAAGGVLPSANLVALNLAARLSDGQEIYVLSIGETLPDGYNPTSDTGGTPTVAPGQLVNINTASESEMRQVLHVSAATAQKIIAYRTQHGAYTSVDQLLLVVSKSIYDRIKTMVTV
jgi:competence protein ComEA